MLGRQHLCAAVDELSQNRESVQQDDFALLVMSLININVNAFFRVQHHTARSGMAACVEQPSARRRSPSVCRRGGDGESSHVTRQLVHDDDDDDAHIL
jgi:hypothetical protein